MYICPFVPQFLIRDIIFLADTKIFPSSKGDYVSNGGPIGVQSVSQEYSQCNVP